jgi:hypothetical protein
MIFVRVALNDTATYTGAFYVPLNPKFAELNRSENYSMLDTIDGPKIKQSTYFNNRSYILQWFRIPHDFTGFQNMIATLNSYMDSVKYVNFGSADYAYPTLGWIKTRVVDVKIGAERGGKIKYNVELTLNPEP